MTVDFESNLGLVRQFIWKHCRPQNPIEDMEEYAQGCVGLLQACQTYDPSTGPFSTYAYRCIRNSIIDEKRREKRRPIFETNVDLERIHRSDREDASAIVSRLMKMPVDNEAEELDRQMLKSHYLGGETLESVGRQYGITKGRVHQRLVRALRKLRENECAVV